MTRVSHDVTWHHHETTDNYKARTTEHLFGKNIISRELFARNTCRSNEFRQNKVILKKVIVKTLFQIRQGDRKENEQSTKKKTKHVDVNNKRKAITKNIVKINRKSTIKNIIVDRFNNNPSKKLYVTNGSFDITENVTHGWEDRDNKLRKIDKGLSIRQKCTEMKCNSFKLNVGKLENRKGRQVCNKNVNRCISNEERRKEEDNPIFTRRSGGIVKKTEGRIDKRRLNLNLMLISMLVLNAVGSTLAEDEPSSFSSGLTTRMISSILGYPHTCSIGGQTRPCTLTLSCWLRGGTRVRGCGGWLFSCCGGPKETDNNIQSSEWKYKVSPPRLRQVPKRSVVPNNAFRRRVDDNVSQVECGLPSSRILQKRIIGGREARFAEFPWQAHVRISEFQCGGVLVSRWFVATAAHCVSRAPLRDIVVWLGAVDTSAGHPATKLGVVQKILHPLFQFRMTQPDRYDIALLKFARPITYSSHILPICLPDYELELRGRSGVIAGWGKTDASTGHTGTNILRSATVPILSREQCITWHQSKQILVEIHSEMICAGHSDGHQDACLGDSGGPLIVQDNGRYYLVGITSAGFGCGVDHQPGIYHNVKITADWIRSVVSSVFYIHF